MAGTSMRLRIGVEASQQGAGYLSRHRLSQFMTQSGQRDVDVVQANTVLQDRQRRRRVGDAFRSVVVGCGAGRHSAAVSLCCRGSHCSHRSGDPNNITYPFSRTSCEYWNGDVMLPHEQRRSHIMNIHTSRLAAELSLQAELSRDRSFTLVLEVMDAYNNKSLEVIESWSYSGILMPGRDWHTLTHPGSVARITYRVRVVCDDLYYNTTCTKFCKPRDDRFGHHDCDESGTKVCKDGWIGSNCDKPVCRDSCHTEHGTCKRPGECECRHGWEGELCDQCQRYPGCKHGNCDGSPWTCECHLNWGGILCDQDLNYCRRYPCQNGGTCENTAPDEYKCTCYDGFSGLNCEIVEDPCAVGPCANGGTCMEVNGGYQCTCPMGWTGNNCSENVDECLSSPCRHNGTCIDAVNGFTCNCTSGWEGNKCQLDSDECQGRPCINAVSCINLDGDYECLCQQGWEGKNCDLNLDDCHNQCLHGATCIDLVDDYHCACDKGFTGKNCETNIDECESSPCQNGGECIDQVAGIQCICPVGFSGQRCEVDIDLCNPDPCENGALCINLQEDFYCHCPEKFGGKNCSEQRPECTQPPCTAVDSCKVPEQQESGQILFVPSNICGFNGRCVSLENSAFSCVCDPGYSGEYCHINVNDCTSNPCRNGGTCVDLNNEFQCVCDIGWEGALCTIDVDECADKPCRNNGTCMDGTNDFTCTCVDGWKGRTCTSLTSHCDSNTCHHDGTCEDLGNTFICHCPFGWKGSICHIPEIRACDSAPCQNGATCVNTGDSYTCICHDGWDGPSCSNNINDCTPQPCYNGGTCVDGVNWHICECATGFTGPDCRLNINECDSSPCAFGSTCIDSVGDFRCMCPPGRTGRHCEHVVGAIPTTDQKTAASCLWGGEFRPHGAVWRHQCNTCHCNHGTASCSDVWCGPENCLRSRDPNHYPCEPLQVCVPGPLEWCLSTPCEPWGECRGLSNDGQKVMPAANPGPSDCVPNNAKLNNGCARLTLVMDLARLPRGARVQTACQGLRAAWADRHAHTKTAPPVILCSLLTGSNDTIEVTLAYPETSEKGDVTLAAKALGELVSRKLTPVTTLAAIIEVKVETTVVSAQPQGTTSGVLAAITVVLVVLIVVALAGIGYWHCRRRHLAALPHQHFPTHSSRHKLAEDGAIEKSNNDNEDKLWRYNNPLKDPVNSGPTNISEPSSSRMILQGPGDPKMAPLAAPGSICLPVAPLTVHSGLPIQPRAAALAIPEADLSDVEQSPTRALPAAIRKVQNADVERNMTPNDLTCKSLQKEINLQVKSLNPRTIEKEQSTSEVVV
ncbi:unnamed protein product, partial [Meganyctiphanes norvegica]